MMITFNNILESVANIVDLPLDADNGAFVYVEDDDCGFILNNGKWEAYLSKKSTIDGDVLKQFNVKVI